MQQRQINLHLVLTIFLGLGMVLFGVLAVKAFQDKEFVNNNLDKLVQESSDRAVAEQKAKDEEAYRIANQEPFRTFIADPVDGGFELQIPKNWSIYAGRNTASQTQLDMISDPNAIIRNLTANAINTHAFRLQIVRRSQQEVVKSYDRYVKEKDPQTKQAMLKGSAVSVSGIRGTRLEGRLDEDRHSGAVVIIPFRDKTMVMITENPKYLPEFNKILETAKIIQ